jgi:tRNA1(Val) A37 N6-methylase TrmN6
MYSKIFYLPTRALRSLLIPSGKAALMLTAIGLCLWLSPLLPSNSYAADNNDYTMIKDLTGPTKSRLVWYYTARSAAIQQPAKVEVQDKTFFIDPGVKAPTVNSVFLLEHSEVKEGEEVLDVGTGSGLHAVFAANKAKRVVATDISARAISNAKRNARLQGVADKIDFRVGDLFAPLKEGEKFDVIFLNIAYPFDKDTVDRWKLHERFFAEVRKYMKPYARIYYQIGFIKNIPYVYDMLNRNQLYIMRMSMVNALKYGTEPITMMIQE